MKQGRQRTSRQTTAPLVAQATTWPVEREEIVGSQVFPFSSAFPGAPQSIGLDGVTMAISSGAHINLLSLALMIVVWLIVYHGVYWALAIARNPSLICWGVGPFGLIVIALRQPGRGLRLAQFVAAGLALASVADVSLFVARPEPITGLDQSPLSELGVVFAVVALATLLRLAANARLRRFPLWGEARVLAGVQRNIARGAVLIFTPLGRAFLRERFNATPNEFIQTMRSQAPYVS